MSVFISPATLQTAAHPGIVFNVLDCVASLHLARPISRRDMLEKKKWLTVVGMNLRLGTLSGVGAVVQSSPELLTYCDVSHPSRLLAMGCRTCAIVYATSRVCAIGSKRLPMDVCECARKAGEMAQTAIGLLSPVPTPVVDSLVLEVQCCETLLGEIASDCLLFSRLAARWASLGVSHAGSKKSTHSSLAAPHVLATTTTSSTSTGLASSNANDLLSTPSSYLYTPALLGGPIFIKLPSLSAPNRAPFAPSIVAFESGKVVIHEVNSLASGASAFAWFLALLKGKTHSQALTAAMEAYCVTDGISLPTMDTREDKSLGVGEKRRRVDDVDGLEGNRSREVGGEDENVKETSEEGEDAESVSGCE